MQSAADLIRIDVVAPSRRYPVVIGIGVGSEVAVHLDRLGFPPRRIVVSSPRVWRLHGTRLAGVGACRPLVVPDGERSKHLRTVLRLYDGLIAAGADRGSGIVAFGGGVIGDMAGFAAASYLRGIAVAHVPTTLLAQVDSAIGGKTGVNLRQGKNLVGAFHQPSAVLVDPALLATLNARDYRSGLYEAVKYGMACSADLFGHIERNLDALTGRVYWAVVPAIAECCRIKARIVAEDEREHGARRVLNFGHTAGHAFEAATAYRRFRHGEAVALGMRVAVAIARTRNVMTRSDAERFEALISRMGRLPAADDVPPDDLLAIVERDKKVVNGQMHFVLPTGIGRVEIVTDVTGDELRAALQTIAAAASSRP